MTADDDPWNLLKRFPGMSKIGRAIMGKKLDRALALKLASVTPGKVARAALLERAALCRLDINRLACTAAKNW